MELEFGRQGVFSCGDDDPRKSIAFLLHLHEPNRFGDDNQYAAIQFLGGKVAERVWVRTSEGQAPPKRLNQYGGGDGIWTPDPLDPEINRLKKRVAQLEKELAGRQTAST